MTFERLQKSVTYAMVLIGLLPMTLSGEVGLIPLLVTYAATAVSWFYDAPKIRDPKAARGWTIASLVALGAVAVLSVATGDYIVYATYFALFLLVTRLFQSRSSRDVFQLYALTFVAVVVGAVINPAASFVVIFLAYVVLLTWGLTLLHLQVNLERMREEGEAFGDQPSDMAWKARELVTPGFLTGSSVLALVVFASSLVIFFFFPRLGFGFFGSQGRQGEQVSGFSDRIELGHFGTIKDNDAVVMRVELPEQRDDANRQLRMRGISFDHYDGRVWSKTMRTQSEVTQEKLGLWKVRQDSPGFYEEPHTTLVQDVYLEPMQMDQRMVFGEPVLASLSIDNARLDRLKREPIRFYEDAGQDVSTRGRTTTALKYRVTSIEPLTPDGDLRTMDGPIPERLRRRYTQLPDGLDPRIEALAREVVGDAATPFAKAERIKRYLERTYAYSTAGGHSRDAPLSDFLFQEIPGHCEYFSTAMVVMLRTVGVAARPANGFYGGVYNAFGQYYQLRQADAHSWVEAFVPGWGWATFDPTPAAEVLVPPDEGLLADLQAGLDSLKLAWYKWVVEYDLEKQLEFFRNLGEQLGGLKEYLPQPENGDTDNPKAWKRGFETWFKDPKVWAALSSPFVLGFAWRQGLFHWLWGLFMAWLARRRRDEAPDWGQVGALYGRMVRVLAKQGHARAPTETPRELAERLERGGYPLSGAVGDVTAAFEESRYAERPLTRERLDRLQAQVEAVAAATGEGA